MKKIIFLIIFCICCMCGTVCNADFTMTASYTVETNTLTFSGTFENKGDFAMLTVCPSGFDREASSDKLLMRTFSIDTDGCFFGRIILPETYEGGEYTLYASNGDSEYSYDFIHVNKLQAADILSRMSLMDYDNFKIEVENNIVGLGLKPDALNENASEKLKYIFAQMPEKGYSPDDFLKAYSRICTFLLIKDGADAKEALIGNSLSFDVDFVSEFAKLTDDEALIVINKIKTESFSDVIFSDEWKKLTVFAKVVCSESYTELKNIFMDNKDIISPDMTYWTKITDDYYRIQVFQQMYKSAITQFSDIAKNFYEISYNVYLTNFHNVTKPSGGSGGGSSSGGSGGFNGSVATGNAVISDNSSQDIADSVDNSKKTDISGHWAESIFEYLVQKGIIDGYTDGKFLPDNCITRAEFVKLIVIAFGIEQDNEQVFPDVKADDWYMGYVSGAYKAGIIEGKENGFCPNENITRQDAAVILYRVVGSNGEDGNEIQLKDMNDVDSYASEAVKNLYKMGVINGDDGSFKPHNNTTRSESAAMIYRILNISDRKNNADNLF